MGIAVTDPLKMIANGLETVDAKNIMTFLEGYFKKEEVDCLVVGNPTQATEGTANRGGDMNQMASDFCARVQEKFPSLKIERIDEFYTSKLAERTMLQSGMNRSSRRDKALVDKISATILLQSYIELNS